MNVFIRILLLLLSGCGLQLGYPTNPDLHEGVNSPFRDGYYLATVDLSVRHYPAVVIKKVGSETRTYQLSNIDKMVFGLGVRAGATPTVLGTVITKSPDFEYVGSIRTEGNFLRLQSRQCQESDEKDPKFPEVGEILSGQDYSLKSVALNEFLKQLRTLRNLPKETVFSRIDEEICQTTFGRSCYKAYFEPL